MIRCPIRREKTPATAITQFRTAHETHLWRGRDAHATSLQLVPRSAGVFQSRQIDAVVQSFPQPLVFMCVGVIAFSLFFPFFLGLYFARHLLISLKRLEVENVALRGEIAKIGEHLDHAAANAD